MLITIFTIYCISSEVAPVAVHRQITRLITSYYTNSSHTKALTTNFSQTTSILVQSANFISSQLISNSCKIVPMPVTSISKLLILFLHYLHIIYLRWYRLRTGTRRTNASGLVPATIFSTRWYYTSS